VIAALLARLLGRQPIGWLQLRHNRARLLAAVAGVGFANLLVLAQLGFLGALTSSIGLVYRAFDADILIQAADANTLNDGSPLPRARMLEALAVPGVAAAAPLHFARFDWKQPDGTVRSLDVFGTDPRAPAFRTPEIEARRHLLALGNTGLVDRGTRNVPPALFAGIEAGQAYRIEANQRHLDLVGTFRVGGGFGADGVAVVSDETFLGLFRSRSPGAPNIVLVRAAPGEDHAALARRINAALSLPDAVARPVAEAIRRDIRFQTTQRPVGIVFGFGVVIGALVGAVITYQILTTDVTDHLREYATFKAIGYAPRFFAGVVMEQAVLLGLLGFVPGALAATGVYAAVRALTGLPLAMDAQRLALVLLGTVAMCALSGVLALRRLARAEPAELF